MIPRTPTLHSALIDVAKRQIDHYSGYYGDPAYVWHSGGVVPAEEQDALRELHAVRLTLEIPAALDGKPGCAVRLSPVGEQVLSLWDAQNSPASGPTDPAGVHLLAGEPNERGER